MSEGVQIGIIGVSTDISALKKKERECVQLNRNLEKIVEQRTRELQEVNQKLEEANVKLREANSLLGKTNQDLSEANNKLKQEVQQHLMAKEELKRTIDVHIFALKGQLSFYFTQSFPGFLVQGRIDEGVGKGKGTCRVSKCSQNQIPGIL